MSITADAFPPSQPTTGLPAMPLPATQEDVLERVRAGGVEFLFAQFVDMHGKPNAKLLPARHLSSLFESGAGFAGFAAGDIGQMPNDPDLEAMPDAASFTPLPWRPHVARLACDVHVSGKPWPYCPRTILRRQLERAAELGYEFKIGVELEYFLVRRREDGSIEPADALDTLAQPCYDMRALTRSFDFVGDVARYLDALGWDGYATDHEDGNGQFEQNFGYADALIKLRSRDLLPLHGREPRSGARPDRDVHAKALPASDGQRRPLSHEPLEGRGERLRDRPRRRSARHGSLPARLQLPRRPEGHAKAYIALTAPTVTSYKRLVLGSRSGSAWAPATSVTATTTALRCCASPAQDGSRTVPSTARAIPTWRRPRCWRQGSTASNAAAIRVRRRAIVNLHQLDAADAPSTASSCCPRTCSTPPASWSATASCATRSAQCATEDYMDYFIRIKRGEWQLAHEQITQWELERYLQLY